MNSVHRQEHPSLLMWKCHPEATAWWVTTPPPWNISLCSLFHTTLRLFSFSDSTTLTLGLSRTPLWTAMLMKRSQEILLNITFQLLCHKPWPHGKCPSGPSLTNQLLSHALSSVLTKVGIPMLLELKASLASLCILKVWECLPLSNFKYFLLSRWDFLEATKYRHSSNLRQAVFKVILKVLSEPATCNRIWRLFTVLQFLCDY